MNKKKTLLLAIVLIGILVVGSTLAFLTDTQTTTNTFTIGNVAIELTEPSWNADNAKDLMPKATIAKDPTIKNTGSNAAYVFLKVEVPKAEVTVDGTASTKELFTHTANEGWYQVSKNETDTTKNVYIYAYATDASTITKLEKNTSTTKALFDNVTLIDFDSLGNDVEPTQNIVVTAYAIQTENIVEGAATPANVWSVISTEFGL